MERLFVSKSFMKKLALVLVIIILFQAVSAKPVQAVGIGGTLLEPVLGLVMALADGAISIVQSSLTNAEEAFIHIDLTGNKVNWLSIVVTAVGWICVAAAVAIATVVSGGAALAIIVPLAATGIGIAGTGIALAFFPQIGETIEEICFGTSFVYANIAVTPEILLKNQIALFDVNFFQEAVATGSDTTHALSVQVREIIREVYLTIRDISIILMMIIAIYIAIKMLISLSPKEKSKYKESFTNCLIGLVLIVMMHYIMSISTSLVTMINNGVISSDVIYEGTQEEAINQLENNQEFKDKYTTGESIGISGENIYKAFTDDDGNVKEGYSKVSLSTTEDGEKKISIAASNFLEIARYKAQRVYDADSEGNNLTERWVRIGWAFAYIMLVVLTMAFVWMYAKRLLYMAILTMFAPIVGLMYPINKVDGSRSQTLNLWLLEYTGNLIIQPFHLFLYTILIGGAMALCINNPIYVIIALIGMSFIEKLLKDLIGIRDTRIGGLGNALKDTNRAIKTATNATKAVARTAGGIINAGTRAAVGAAEGIRNNQMANKANGEVEEAKTPREAKNANVLPNTEEAKKEAQGDVFDQPLEDPDPYLVEKSFKATEDFGLDEGDEFGTETNFNNQPESLYASDEEVAEQLREQGLSDEEIDEAIRIRNGTTEPTAEQLARGINEDGIEMIDDSLYMSEANNPEVSAFGMTEDGIEMVDDALYMSNTNTPTVAGTGMTEDGIEMVNDALYMSNTNTPTVAGTGMAEDGVEMVNDSGYVHGVDNKKSVGAQALANNDNYNIGEGDLGEIDSNSQLAKPPAFLDAETMSRISQERMAEIEGKGGQRIQTSSGLEGVVSSDGKVIATDLTQIGQKNKSNPKSADAKANQIPKAVGQNAFGNNQINTSGDNGAKPKLSVVTPRGTSGSSAVGNYSSSSASTQSGSAGNVSKIAYKGGGATTSSTSETSRPKLEVVKPQATKIEPKLEKVEQQPQISQPEPRPETVEKQTQVSQPELKEQTGTETPQIAPETVQTNDTQSNKTSRKDEKIVSGIEKAVSIAGEIAGATGKVAGNTFEGVLDLAVDAITNPGAIVDDITKTVAGDVQAIASAGGNVVSSRGKGQLSDDAKYLMREGNTEQRAQYVENFCEQARRKGMVIDTKEDKRSLARALKDIGDKNDKTINSLMLEAIKHKRNGKSRADYEKYIDGKGVSSTAKNVLLKLYDEARK